MIALVAARLVSLALFLVPIAVTRPAFPALALVNSVAAYLVFLASFLVAVVVTELVFLALAVVNFSLNAQAFLRLTKQTTEITGAISTTAPTLSPIAIFLVFPVVSKITDDKNSWNLSERVQRGGGATVKLKGRLNSVTDGCNHKTDVI